jgi:hypothetical protein
MKFMRTSLFLLFALFFLAQPVFANTFPFVIEDGLLRPGETISVPVKAGSALDIRGFQFELNFDSTIFTVLEIVPSKLPGLSILNFTQPTSGSITGNWTNLDGKLIEPGTLLFTLILKVAKPGLIHESLMLSNKTIQSEVYDDGDEAYDLSLAFSPPNGGNIQIQKSEIFSAQPNPAVFDAKIPIWLSTETFVTWSLMDISGKIIFNEKTLMDRGAQNLLIPYEAMNTAATYIWQVQFESSKKQGILVKI